MGTVSGHGRACAQGLALRHHLLVDFEVGLAPRAVGGGARGGCQGVALPLGQSVVVQGPVRTSTGHRRLPAILRCTFSLPRIDVDPPPPCS